MDYAIKDTTLTAIADAVRNKTGHVIKERVHSRDLTSFQFPITKSEDGWDDCSIKIELLDANLWHSARLSIIHYSNNQRDEESGNYISTTLMDNKLFSEITFPYVIQNHAFQSYDRLNFSLTSIAQEHFADFEITMTLLDETDKEPIRFTPLEMVEQLNNSMPTPAAKDLFITGSCRNFNTYGNWDWFIEKYGSEMKTYNINELTQGFYYSTLSTIPFELNFDPNLADGASLESCFQGMKNLTEPPRMNNLKVNKLSSAFKGCENITEFPDDYCDTWDWSYIKNLTVGYYGAMNAIFQECKKLRKFPMTFFAGGNSLVGYGSCCFYNQFNNCWMLDEIVDMPNPHPKATWTSNAFYGFCERCYRLKRLTFANMPWPSGLKSQTLDLSSYVGWGATNFTGAPGYQVSNDEEYQARKNSPDWWTYDMAYSRYNHDSAVETIRSLPDLSGGSNNIIKFKGEAGSKTDGGAINTLTEEEIAIATAKGWTVSIV